MCLDLGGCWFAFTRSPSHTQAVCLDLITVRLCPTLTDCICTLRLFYCTLYVPSANVTNFVFFCVWTSFSCNNSFTYVLRAVILDITKSHGQSAREKERRYQLPVVQTIRKEYLAVARLLLPTSSLLLPSTVCIWRCEQDWKPGSQITSRPTTDELLTVTAMEDTGDIPPFVVYI